MVLGLKMKPTNHYWDFLPNITPSTDIGENVSLKKLYKYESFTKAVYKYSQIIHRGLERSAAGTLGGKTGSDWIWAEFVDLTVKQCIKLMTNKGQKASVKSHQSISSK